MKLGNILKFEVIVCGGWFFVLFRGREVHHNGASLFAVYLES